MGSLCFKFRKSLILNGGQRRDRTVHADPFSAALCERLVYLEGSLLAKMLADGVCANPRCRREAPP
jgi:hypothetical protein